MNNYKYIKSAILGVVFIFSLTSCSEGTMDKINGIDNYPLDAPARMSVTELLVNSAFSVGGGDFNLYSSIYMEHVGGINNQTYNAEKRLAETTSASTMNNAWEGAYRNVKNAKNIIKKCSEGGSDAGSDITLGIAKTMLAYNGAILTDLFGDIPFEQAGELNELGLPVYFNPKMDKQEDVYKSIFKLLDEAIVLFDGEDNGPNGAVGSQDFYYGGDGVSWKKAAYALKARYTLRLLSTYEDKNAELNKILGYIEKSFDNASEEMKFSEYDGNAQVNPLFGFSKSRMGLGASQSFVNKLKERKDPRLTQMFTNGRTKSSEIFNTYPVIEDANNLKLVPNGDPKNGTGIYSVLVTDFSPSVPTKLISYHELLFIKAEAEARLGKSEAENTLKSAMIVAFANLEESIRDAFSKKTITALPNSFDLSATAVEQYFTNDIKALYDANPVKEIMNQKYLAFAGANGESTEVYNDYRRLQALNEADFIKLENPSNTDAKAKKFPLRYVYGTGTISNNAEIKELVGDGTYVYSEPVWWAGGTR